ncbi:MAG: alpha-1,2-fucosyltransferase [Lachnospiraceae bacterium]|nr:alpha-1,2-fucosyltransferase [Lachnospiraceae bacterium]
MIYVNITGGLGNQLFQYAFARKIQRETDQNITLNIFELQKYDNKRRFELDKFDLVNHVKISGQKPPWYVHRRSIVGKVIRKFSERVMFSIGLLHNSCVWYGEKKISIPLFNKDKDIYIGGYWQMGEYSNDIIEELRLDFTLQSQYREEVKKWESIISNVEDSVCLHIRRGDYVGTPYEVCTIKYYEAGIKYICAKLKKPEIFVFSDDMEWTKKNIKCSENINYIDEGYKGYQDMYLMSLCHNFIISNSTFSWWGQHLSDRNKIVIAPSKWHKKIDNISLYEKSWILITDKGEVL